MLVLYHTAALPNALSMVFVCLYPVCALFLGLGTDTDRQTESPKTRVRDCMPPVDYYSSSTSPNTTITLNGTGPYLYCATVESTSKSWTVLVSVLYVHTVAL
jgi:hypothetical protein